MKNKMQWYSLWFFSLCPLCLCGSSAYSAETLERYDLGQRLVLLERAWDAHPDAAARARALPVLKLAVPQLLAGKTTKAAETLDRARLLLQSPEPRAAERWAASLLVHPSIRLLDPAQGPLTVRVEPAYPAGERPANASMRLTLLIGNGPTAVTSAAIALSTPAVTERLSVERLPEGDHTLRAEVIVDSDTVATYVVGISVVPRLRERLDRLRLPANSRSVDVATRGTVAALLAWLALGGALEANYPAARLLAEEDELAKSIAAGKRFFGPQRTGQFWLAIPTGDTNTPVRLFVPEQAKAGKPLPLVVALHGAGGSENLFFDAYGSGLIARLAAERGWMVVAPRAGGLFDGPPPVPAIVDELAKLYPVDPKRVYIVGHSMGAMQAITLAQQSPGRFAAVAALGSGGTVTRGETFKDLPVYIGCGREDFLLSGAKALAEALAKAGATRMTFKEYPAVEHMLIVQEALPEVFRFFERSVSDVSRKRD
jgi:dienelactone hydrolase